MAGGELEPLEPEQPELERVGEPMKSIRSYLVHGALAGALGAATMTVLRMVAHRAGWIQAMVPQAVEVWAKDKSPLRWPRRAEAHHVADQLLHLGYGGAAGSVYALTHATGEHAEPSRAIELGTALWAFGSFVLFPALTIARPPWRHGGRSWSTSAHSSLRCRHRLPARRIREAKAHGALHADVDASRPGGLSGIRHRPNRPRARGPTSVGFRCGGLGAGG